MSLKPFPTLATAEFVGTPPPAADLSPAPVALPFIAENHYGDRAHIVAVFVNTESPDSAPVTVSLGTLEGEKINLVLSRFKEEINRRELSCFRRGLFVEAVSDESPGDVRPGRTFYTAASAAHALGVTAPAISIARKRAIFDYESGKATDKSFVVCGVRMYALDDVKD